MGWKEAYSFGQEAVLVTSSMSGDPHAIYVICKGIETGDKQILLSVCQMNKSLTNLKENTKLCLVTKDDSGYYRIKGTGTLYSSGRYFDLAVERNTKGTPTPNFALVIDIESIHDVDKVRRIL
jgi:hypothetical protein